MRSTLAPRVTSRQHSVARSEPRSVPSWAPRAEHGAPAGLPLYLRRVRVDPRLAINPSPSASEQEADRVADGPQSGEAASYSSVVPNASAAGAIEEPSLLGGMIRQSLRETRGSGTPLPPTKRAAMEERFGADFSGVRIYTDSRAQRLSQTLGANAFTTGRDIYFNENRYGPSAPDGDRLLAHELAHVVQQGGKQNGPVQCDLMMSLPTALGVFEIAMVTRGAPMAPGLDGDIRFLPDPSGPYSTQIGLIQAVTVTDIAGSTTPAAGAPVDWSNVGTGAERDRNTLMTTGLHGAPPGWFIDTITARYTQGQAVSPNYQDDVLAVPNNQYGWLRSPTDWQASVISDYPNFSVDCDMDFETVAKATDTQTIYGALTWGFQIRSGVVSGEYAHAHSSESATFNEALERFRGYYTHEPIVLYFDTDVDTPLPGEDAKIAGVLGYLGRYPDVTLEIDGYADERGSAAHNLDLSFRRAANVERLCVAMGIAAARIGPTSGWGETTTFSRGSPGHNAGTWRANRRVVISFERTASTPIVMPPP